MQAFQQHIQQQIKIAFRDNFGPTMALFIVGTIAFVFIGYLFIDLIRSLVLGFLARRRHRKEMRERMMD